MDLIEAKEITIEARTENLFRLTDLVHECLEKVNCSFKNLFQIDMAAEELFQNICKYAYAPLVGMVGIKIELYRQPATVSITFSDSGVPYNPLEKADPDLSLPIEDRPIGGLGIYLVKDKMDDVRYEYRDGQNIVTITKRI